jgi:phosphopantothenoylcysteine decarboxylase/phosphopantothenate--cysteine ligase
MKLLVTAGATREPIDAVRFLSNVSTGRTGAELAGALAARGHTVLLLRGTGAVAAPVGVDAQVFSTAEDLLGQLRRLLAGGDFAGVIMTAAVADYRPETADTGKLDSAVPTRTLHLVRNPKILPQLRGFSPRPLHVIGFKLTVGADAVARLAAVRRQFDDSRVDAVVHNDLAEIKTATVHPFRLFTGPELEPSPLAGVPVLAAALDTLLRKAP